MSLPAPLVVADAEAEADGARLLAGAVATAPMPVRTPEAVCCGGGLGAARGRKLETHRWVRGGRCGSKEVAEHVRARGRGVDHTGKARVKIEREEDGISYPAIPRLQCLRGICC